MAGRCQEIVVAIQPDTLIVNEVPDGLVNSSNTEYILANDPLIGSVAVYLNGLLQTPGTGKDYTISGKDISFTKAPRNNSEILVSYAQEIAT